MKRENSFLPIILCLTVFIRSYGLCYRRCDVKIGGGDRI